LLQPQWGRLPTTALASLLLRTETKNIKITANANNNKVRKVTTTKNMMIVLCSFTALVMLACSETNTGPDTGMTNADVIESDGDGDESDDRNDGGANGEVDDDGTDGFVECETALDCAFDCDPNEACALECGERGLDSQTKAAFEALVMCMVEANCGLNEACLDASCEPEFRVFDNLCT
jgi:hypothetical protein